MQRYRRLKIRHSCWRTVTRPNRTREWLERLFHIRFARLKGKAKESWISPKTNGEADEMFDRFTKALEVKLTLYSKYDGVADTFHLVVIIRNKALIYLVSNRSLMQIIYISIF